MYHVYRLVLLLLLSSVILQCTCTCVTYTCTKLLHIIHDSAIIAVCKCIPYVYTVVVICTIMLHTYNYTES